MSNADDDPKQAARARAAAERKETEDSLAGFDCPGRTPRMPAVRRDFVDYFQKERPSAAPRAQSAAPPPPTPQPAQPGPGPSSEQRRAVPTFVSRKERIGFPVWLAPAALLFAMPTAGGVIAYVAHERTPPSRVHTPSPRLTEATTIPAATSPVEEPAPTPRPSAPTSVASAPPAVPAPSARPAGAMPAPSARASIRVSTSSGTFEEQREPRHEGISASDRRICSRSRARSRSPMSRARSRVSPRSRVVRRRSTPHQPRPDSASTRGLRSPTPAITRPRDSSSTRRGSFSRAPRSSTTSLAPSSSPPARGARPLSPLRHDGIRSQGDRRSAPAREGERRRALEEGRSDRRRRTSDRAYLDRRPSDRSRQ